MAIDPDSLEPAIRDIGRELARVSAGQSPALFDHRRWSQTLLDWTVKDPQFKVQLFRFVDVLPVLHHDDQVARLVEEYFGHDPALGAPLKWGMKIMTGTALAAKIGARTIRHQVEQMARMFIAGSTVAEAAPGLSRLWRDGRACSVDLLGEASVSETESDRYLDRCLAALDDLASAEHPWPAQPLLERDHVGLLPRVQLSIKLSALYSQLDPIDPDGCYKAIAPRLRRLLDRAHRIPASIIFDMEQAELKDLTLSTFMRLFGEPPYRAFPYAGVAIQAYLRETGQDIDRLLHWTKQRGTPIMIRLVKGAYWDSETIRYQQRGWPVPVFEQKWQTDVHYEALSRTLLDHHRWIRPAFGTHNLRSLAHVEAYAQALGLSPDTWEYQMIYGMAEPLQAAVVRHPRRLRLYTPVGDLLPGMAYLVRRLLENTSNESFLRKEYMESQPIDELLERPGPPRHAPANPSKPPAPDSEFHNEPHADFSLEPVRDAQAEAIAAVRANSGQQIFYQVGPDIHPSGPVMRSRNPCQPDEVLGVFTSCSPTDVEKMSTIARSRVATWAGAAVAMRVGVLRRAAAIMRKRRYELAAWEILEAGKSWREADADVAEAIDFLEFYAVEMTRLDHPQRLGHEPGEHNTLRYAPRGVAAVIAPWNFPLAIPTGMVAAALVTGNPVLFKPSERALIVGSVLTEILAEAGVPAGVLQVLPGGPDVGRALVEQGSADIIAFTGSKTVGRWILQEAARERKGHRHIPRVIAEMGGKNAIIVDETADLDEAVVGVIASFTGYQGQKCSACSRAVVHEAIHDLFLERLTDAVLAIRIGNPQDPGTQMGPMIDARARDKVREYIEVGKSEGRLVVERQLEGAGYLQGPAVFADIEPQHRLAQEEIFGPVLAVMKARTFERALEIANSTEYALTGGVYSRSPGHLDLARARFDVGNLYINRPITGALVGRQPFGGHRMSGVGAKAGGRDYLQQFLVARVVSENTLRRGFAPLE